MESGYLSVSNREIVSKTALNVSDYYPLMQVVVSLIQILPSRCLSVLSDNEPTWTTSSCNFSVYMSAFETGGLDRSWIVADSNARVQSGDDEFLAASAVEMSLLVRES